jgi:CubicO group peptidase (beta-lactamase class C family)
MVAGMTRRSMPALKRVQLTRPFFQALYVPLFDEVLSGRHPAVLDTEMPAVNGVVSADGLSLLYAAIANDGTVDGVRLLSPAAAHRLSVVQTRARDVVIGMRMNWRMGYHRGGVQGYRGDAIFGHYGFGGSGGWADPTTGLSFGFVTNELRILQAPVGGDGRIFRLSGLALRCGRALLEGRDG